MTDPTPEQRAAWLWTAILHGATGNEFIILAEKEIYAAIRASEQAQAERDARLCESHWYDAWRGNLNKDSRGQPVLANTAGNAYAAAIREADNEHAVPGS